MANDTRKYVESFPAHELIGIVKEMLLHFRQHVLGGMGFTEFPPFPPCTNTSESVAQIAIICAAFRQIELLIGDLRVGHAYSMKHGYHLCTLLRVNYDEFRHSTSRSVVDLVRLDFRNRFAYLPHPRCLEEAFEMRVDARLVRLRRKIDAWIRYSQGRSEDISSKIDNDIQRALKEISFVRKWENLKEGNLYIVFTAIAGQVPILSNVISGLTTIEQLISKHKEKHFGWIG
jgi:hypothetical protein